MIAPDCVQEIADKPGLYRFNEERDNYYWFFEVVEDGKIYQLDPTTFQRDGLLRADGWHTNAEFGTVIKLNLQRITDEQ